MNGLGTALTVAAGGIGIGAAAMLLIGWQLQNRVPPKPRPVNLTPPPDVTCWTGEGWTERDESMRRHPSTRARALGGDQ